MINIRHPLNIGTLAVWMSISGFGMVGLLIPMPEPPLRKVERVSEVVLIHEDFEVGESSVPTTKTALSVPVSVPVPQPPALPDMAEIEPLPPLPAMPAPAPRAVVPLPAGAPTAGAASSTSRSSAESPRTSGATNGNGSSGMPNNARIAAGRMPSPAYPPYSRRNNQQGTVIVEFTVDRNGKFISAYAKKPSPWPLLNQEAVSTVRLWRFPPGGVMTLQRPIVFQLR